MSRPESSFQPLSNEQASAIIGRAAQTVHDKGLSRWKKVAVIACAVFLLSPVDPIPEVVFGPLGLVDDAGYLATLVTAGSMALRRRAANVVNGG